MEISPYAEVGAKLVERGYAAIPVLPGSKRPGEMRNGNWMGMLDWRDRYSLRLPTEIEIAHWSSYPDAGVCVVAGLASHDLVGIDVDDPRVLQAIRAALPPTPVSKAGQRGETLFFRGQIPSVSFNAYSPSGERLGRLVDIIGAGRQSLVPGSIHPDTGQPYRWTGLRALEDVDPHDLPELPGDTVEILAAALHPFGYRPDAPPRPAREAADSDDPFRALNNAALANLDAWVPQLGLYKCKRSARGYRAVATWRASHTGRPSEARSPNLKIHQDGIRDFHDGDRTYTAIDLVMVACDCDFDTAYLTLSQALGQVPETVTLPATPRVEEIDPSTGEISPPPPADSRDFPDADLRPPGLVGDITDWIVATSPKPIRLFAVAAALATVGTLVNRRVYCGTPRSGTSLYLMTIAGTGAGKERPQEAVRQVLDAVCSSGLHGGASASASSLAVRLAEKPVQVQIIDEFDSVLRKVGHRNASSQEAELLRDYCSLWGKNLGTFAPTTTTTRSDTTIVRPGLSVLGATTPAAFYEHMRGRMLANGFLNRFLVLPRFERVPFQPNVAPEDEIPATIVDAARALYHFQDQCPLNIAPGNFTPPTATLQDRVRVPAPHVVEMTPAAEELYAAARARDEEMLIASDHDPMLEAWSRGAELTKRVALIVAVGRYAARGLAGCVVDEVDMRFAARLVDWCLEHFVIGLRENMAENDHQANSKMVLALIRKARQMTRAELYKKIDGRIETRFLDGILNMLVDAGQIEQELAGTTKLGGRPKRLYRFVA